MAEQAPLLELRNEAILILAPTGQDDRLLALALTKEGLQAEIFR